MVQTLVHPEAVVIGSHENVLEGDRENRLRTNAAYLDVSEHDQSFTSRLGRQTGNSSGVYTRFDGGRGGYRRHPEHHLARPRAVH